MQIKTATMNYTAILETLGQASLFQLYRLNVAISNLLDDPARITAVKHTLRIGQTVRWFDNTENRVVEAKLLRMNRTRAAVQNIADGKHWNIPYYLIDLAGEDVAIAARKRQAFDRNSLRVGDQVGFKDRHGHERFGLVVKLNPKSASVQVGTVRWRVGYSLLVPVIDGALGDGVEVLPGQWTRITDEGRSESSPLLPGLPSPDEDDDSDVIEIE